MGYTVRDGKIGFECDVCGVFIGDLKFYKSCYRCHKTICSLCSTLTFIPNKLPPQFFRYRRIEKPSYVCPDCYEELDIERLEGEIKEDQEPPRPIATCQICGADDSPPDHKMFGYRSPEFLNCDKCGRLGCDNCISGSPGGHYEYNVVCRECYEFIEQEEVREREEYWREEEENKLEE